MIGFTTERGDEIDLMCIEAIIVEEYNQGTSKRRVLITHSGARIVLTKNDYACIKAIRDKAEGRLGLELPHTKAEYLSLINQRLNALRVPPAMAATWKRFWAEHAGHRTLDELDVPQLAIVHNELASPDPIAFQAVEQMVLQRSTLNALQVKPRRTLRWAKGAK